MHFTFGYFRKFRSTLPWKSLFIVAVAILGIASILSGSYLVYSVYFSTPAYSYIPTDDAWRQHLATVVKMAEEYSQAETSLSAQSSSSSGVIWVEVSGAVEKPGVYSFSKGSRIQDAILSAGGFQKEANTKFIHKDLNLALHLVDQQKIYIPFVEDTIATNVGEVSVSSSGKKSINQATQKELESIKGVGEKKSSDLISGIPYSSLEDLTSRNVLSQAILDELQNLYYFD